MHAMDQTKTQRKSDKQKFLNSNESSLKAGHNENLLKTKANKVHCKQRQKKMRRSSTDVI
jgi:hypothetical protein